MSTTAALVGPLALAHVLRRGPPAPTDLVRLLGRAEVELAFRELVRRLLPEDEPAILGAGRARHDRDAERVWAFCSAFEQRYFPIYECEEPEQLLYSIPFVRLGWGYDAFHDLDLRPGTLQLRALCAEPYAGSLGARVPLLEAVEHLGVPREVLQRVPGDGLEPADLHAVLDRGLVRHHSGRRSAARDRCCAGHSRGGYDESPRARPEPPARADSAGG